METTIMGYVGVVGVIFGLYWGNGKENGNYCNGLYRGLFSSAAMVSTNCFFLATTTAAWSNGAVDRNFVPYFLPLELPLNPKPYWVSFKY